jgi:hypothetical protein
MFNEFMTPLAGAAALLALFCGIALLMWIDYRSKIREKEHAHTERLRAIEAGQPLPDVDVARAQADATRSRSAALTAIFVPLGMAGAAVGATALVFHLADLHVQLPLGCVIWGVCGLVSLVAITNSLGVMRRRERLDGRVQRSPRERVNPRTPETIRELERPVNTMG